MKFNFPRKINVKETLFLVMLVLGLMFLYVDTATSDYPWNTIYLFSGYALIIISIFLSIVLKK
jgi:hypothetical protein